MCYIEFHFPAEASRKKAATTGCINVKRGGPPFSGAYSQGFSSSGACRTDAQLFVETPQNWTSNSSTRSYLPFTEDLGTPDCLT